MTKRVGGIFYENGSKLEVQQTDKGSVVLIFGREGREMKAEMRADQAKRIGECLIKAAVRQ